MLSIIIPVFNQASYTKACLEALFLTCGELDSYEVIIIDNCSTDATPEVIAALKTHIPIKYIRNQSNLGFTLGSNLGAANAKGETLLFLNNDTVPQAGWREELEFCLSDPNVGIVGPRLLYPTSLEINHAGYVYNPKLGGFYPIYHGYQGTFPGVLKKRKYQALLGACLMMRCDTFKKLSGFTEIGLEDIDLCLRTRELGLEVLYVPSAVVYHHGSVTLNNSEFGSMPIYSNEQFSERWKGARLKWDDYSYYIEDKILPEVAQLDAAKSYAFLEKSIQALVQEVDSQSWEFLCQSLEAYPGNTEALSEKVVLALSQNHLQEAQLICKEILKQGANFGEALMFVAIVYQKIGMKSEMLSVAKSVENLKWSASETRALAQKMILEVV